MDWQQPSQLCQSLPHFSTIMRQIFCWHLSRLGTGRSINEHNTIPFNGHFLSIPLVCNFMLKCSVILPFPFQATLRVQYSNKRYYRKQQLILLCCLCKDNFLQKFGILSQSISKNKGHDIIHSFNRSSTTKNLLWFKVLQEQERQTLHVKCCTTCPVQSLWG